MAQILYGDWCDPIDMFGTGVIGDDKTRGHGRGVNARLSAHLFMTLLDTIETLETARVVKSLSALSGLKKTVLELKKFSNQLRKNIIKFAWEEAEPISGSGFIDTIHEYKKNGKVPKYTKGEIGYTLGSIRKDREFDGRQRRVLTANAWGLIMMQAKRSFLEPIKNVEKKSKGLLAMLDKMLFEKNLGLKLYSTFISNNQEARHYVGRMGIVPSGTAENGEYHHAQVMMHFFRLSLKGQNDKVWEQFKPMMSVNRDAGMCGPFETPATSYAADKKDPAYGKGMYFGLSGSVDWIVDIFQKMVGVELNLLDDTKPALSVEPRLAKEIDNTLSYKRIVHFATGKGKYRVIPLTLEISKQGKGKKLRGESFKVNGKKVEKAELANLSKMKAIKIEIIKRYGD
jgi:hypothetical protein